MSQKIGPDAHMTQYALVGSRSVFIGDTMSMTDSGILKRAARLGVMLGSRFERYNRCPVCEAWTTSGGKPRKDIECPAVQAMAAAGLTEQSCQSAQVRNDQG